MFRIRVCGERDPSDQEIVVPRRRSIIPEGFQIMPTDLHGTWLHQWVEPCGALRDL